ncbi:hypothetical protein As57867_001732, partial [Aphanomyces stellatus]
MITCRSLALFLTAASTLGMQAQQSSCPYTANTLVTDKALCPRTNLTCIVNKTCKYVGTTSNASWSAVGNFKDYTSDFWRFNGFAQQIDLSMMELPDRMPSVEFKNISKFILPDTFKWPSNMTGLYFQYDRLKTIPRIPATTQKLYVYGNFLSSNEELQKLIATTPNLAWIDLGDNNYTQLVNLDMSKMTHVFFYNNDYLQRLENITFGNGILNLDLSYLNITNWIMDNKTFIALNTTLKPNTTAANSEATDGKFDTGYNYYGLTITSDLAECNLKNGVIQELWGDKRTRDKGENKEIFNVCVLKDPVVIDLKGVGLSTGAIVGIAVGAAA